MNEEQQKENWERLDKEIREAVRKEYFRGNIAITAAMQRVFGLNPEYNTEPSELLFVERKKVQDLYSAYQRARKTNSTLDKAVFDGRMDMLEDLFGDRCMPDEEPSDLSTQDPKPSTQDNDNMEEKELNLCELLKGCEKEKFYSPTLGDAFIVQIRETSIHIVPCDERYGERFLFIDKCGILVKGGQCILYPSRALYEKYPLDPSQAWREWAEERKPKRWYPEFGEKLWYLDSSMNPRSVTSALPKSKWEGELNCFKTEEECQQAAEAVRECLAKFNENQSKQ